MIINLQNGVQFVKTLTCPHLNDWENYVICKIAILKSYLIKWFDLPRYSQHSLICTTE